MVVIVLLVFNCWLSYFFVVIGGWFYLLNIFLTLIFLMNEWWGTGWIIEV